MVRTGNQPLSKRLKRSIKTQLRSVKGKLVEVFLAYDASDLASALRRAGIGPSDTVLVHANYKAQSGFRGTLRELVGVFVESIGAEGNLMMVSQPFRGYAYDYLNQGKRFDVRRTVSMMGLLTEMFRRVPGTLRSLHPTHPVLAYGRNASEIVAGHQHCLYPCGEGSPFEKLRQLHGKILFFDVSSGANTFFHHVEDLFKGKLSFPVYDEKLFSVDVVDADGEPQKVSTYAFAPGVIRHTGKLEQELARRRLLTRVRVGNSNLIVVAADDVVRVMAEMIDSGQALIEPPAN